MTNEQWLKHLGIQADWLPSRLAVMADYGENRWWEAEDLRRVAREQLDAPYLLVPARDYHRGMCLLLGREVAVEEFRASNIPTLRQEASKAWRQYRGGHGLWRDAHLGQEG